MIIIYFGKSASGKDTLMKKQLRHGIKPIISYTTRPKRINEVDGIDYNFVTIDEFNKLKEKGDIIESRLYHTLVQGKPDKWYYGTPRVNPQENYVAVLDIKGIIACINEYGTDNINLIYVYTDDNVREERAKLRGSFDKTELDRRFKDDEIKFSDEAINDLIKNYYKQPIAKIDNTHEKPMFSLIKEK